MRYRMNLQLFDDGAGAGSGGQGGNAGLETAVKDPLGAHPERIIPEHIPMNSWKKSRVQG